MVTIFNGVGSHFLGKVYSRNIKDKDKRMKILTQLFENIKNVKFYGIEEDAKKRA